MDTGINPAKAAEVRIDVSDWRDKVLASETLITSREDVIALLAAGMTTGELAKIVSISRLLEIAPQDLIKPDKLLYYTGLQAAVSGIARSEKVAVQTADGTEHNAPRFSGPLREPEANGDDVTFQTATNVLDPKPDAYADMSQTDGVPVVLERARGYLRNIIPGHIYNRLLLIYQCRGDVQAEAEALIAAIRAQVADITQP